MPLAWGLVATVVLILALTWGTLLVQVTLAGFLNGESIWSKSQKQAVIELDAYAVEGDPAALAEFKRSYAIVLSDAWARDAIASGHFDRKQVAAAFARGSVMPDAIPGMIFIFEHFSGAPYISEALRMWHSVDGQIAELGTIAGKLERARKSGSITQEEIARQRRRIHTLNDFIEPRANRFSLEIAEGATWIARVLFIGVVSAAALAIFLWLLMARRTLARIRGSEERYRLLFDSAPDAIVMVDESSGRVLDANRTASAWTGREPRELIGDAYADLFIAQDAPNDGHAACALRGEFGLPKPVDTQSSLAVWGERVVRQTILRDVSERVERERERRIASEALASIAEGVIIADAQRHVISVNAAATQITGFTTESLAGLRLDDARSMPDGSPLPQSIWDEIATGHTWAGEVVSLRADSSNYPEKLSISAIRDAAQKVQQYVAVFSDITSTKADRRRLEHLATHDPLTGLVNRAEFERRCTEAIAAAGRERSAAAVLFIDLDAFKFVNDSYSHGIGDRLLAQVAERITRQLSRGDIAGRIGGDEFTVLARHLILREDAASLANRLLATLSEPFHVDGYEIVLSASIGIAGFPLDGADALTLIANADAAMYAAKSEERNAWRFYAPMMHADTRKRLLLVTELRQALQRDEFRLVYQPSVEMSSGRIVAAEALLRWQHPERGEVMPGEFIPVAESLGLIHRIDEWVMRAVCAQLAAWDESGMPQIRVALNVSARWFGHAAFVESIRHTLQSHGVAPQRILLEITEGAMLKLGEDTERTMQALHALGIAVAIDDFGTGYSSMAYLKLPAVEYMKIDRSFVTGLPESANDAAITEAMLAMAKTLGLTPIAEGIETEAQHEFLLRAGCVEGQGYLYSYPLPAAAIERMLRPKQQPAGSKLKLVRPKRAQP
ncbi:MAG TPA: EAL domain-containing protein [Rhodanobacteraceae bacterium]|nr:EAL domain-containing protein [Rhodanobacteraceae bacterium]